MLFRNIVQENYNNKTDMTTTERMKLIGAKNDARLDTVVPSALKEIVVEQAEKENMPISLYVKVALVEKIERDTQQQ